MPLTVPAMRPHDAPLCRSAPPPVRGVFPLDHDGECKSSMKEYLSCIRVENSAHARCRALSKAYLACRMQRGLMESEDLGHFGMDDTGIKQGLSSAAAAASGAAAAAGASAAAAGGGDGAANTSPQPTKFVSRRKRARRPREWRLAHRLLRAVVDRRGAAHRHLTH